MLAIRVPTLSAAVVPVLVGSALAARSYPFDLLVFVIVLGAAILIQIGTNLTNDLFDFRKGADTGARLGPVRVVQAGLLSQKQVAAAIALTFGLAIVLGLYLIDVGGWPILAIGIPSVAAGYFYTASPVSLAYVALGELTVFIFMGPAIVMGAYFVMALHFSAAALWASIALGFLVAGILHSNNIRDIESDGRHGKRTLATMLGRAGANYELMALDVAAYATTVVGVLAHALPWIALIVFITVPRALDQVRIVTRENDPKKLNVGLFRSIQLHMEFGLLMIAAFLVAAFFGW